MLSAYRKRFSCNNVIIKCIEEWKMFLDRKEYVGCLLMDLSKAFDCLPHGLLLSKLSAYGLHENACLFIKSYLSDRSQRVKIDRSCSSWLQLKRGIPQGSLLGPLLFNLFLNDLLIQLKDHCTVFNYADDNSLSCHHSDLKSLVSNLEMASERALAWFDCNFMKANPDKFNLILLTGRNQHEEVTMQLRNTKITSVDEVKLLGVTLDKDLSFTPHIRNLCKKVAKQVNAMSRLSSMLSPQTKWSVFNSFVKSNFAYCTVVFHHCGVQNDKKLEKMHERAIRVVYNDYVSPYKTLLERSKRKLLYEEREDMLIELVFKVLHGLSPPIDNNMFVRQSFNHNLRDTNILKTPNYETVKFGFNSLKVSGALCWNRLPNAIKNCDTLGCLKNALHNYRPQCECGSCVKCFFYVSR